MVLHSPRFGNFILVAFLAVFACSDSEGLTAIEIPIATIEIVGGSSSLLVNQGNPFHLEVEARTAEGQIIANPVIRWRSNNPSIASIDDEGNGFGVGGGTTQIVASNSTGTTSDQIRVNVIPPGQK